MILFLVVAAPWYVSQFAVNGQEFVDQFFIKHHFKRYLDVISGHKGPFYYYIPVLIVGLFPWSIFLPAGLRNAIKTKDPLFLFALVWFVFIFVFFSFSTTKLPNYLLPAMPAACLLIASGMTEHSKRWWQYSNTALAVSSFMIGIALLISRSYLFTYGFSDLNWIFLLASINMAMGILFLYSTYAEKAFYFVMSALMLAFLLMLSIKATPLAGDYLQGSLYRYSLYAKTNLPGDQRIITYGINNPSIVFYSGHKVINAGNKDDIKAALMKNGEYSIAITKTRKADDLKDLGFKVIESDEKYALLEKK